jgi:hypothetical protein
MSDLSSVSQSLLDSHWPMQDVGLLLSSSLHFTRWSASLNLSDRTRRLLATYTRDASIDRAAVRNVVREVHDALPYNLATLIEDISEPTSEVAAYYQRVFERANSEEMRQVLRALDALRPYLQHD